MGNEYSFAKIANALEKISEEGITVYLKCDNTVSSEKMALDLAAMKVSDALYNVASAINEISER